MIHKKDLATSRPEFFRNLDVALKGQPYDIQGDQITVASGEKRIEMHIAPLPARQLGPLLSLERWQLTMEFTDYTDADREAFLASFDQAFRRGGG